MAKKKERLTITERFTILFHIYIIVAPILMVLTFIIENIEFLLFALLLLGPIIAVIAVISSAARKAAEEEALKQQKLSIINAPEPAPVLIEIPHRVPASTKEEDVINQQLHTFLRQTNTVIEIQTHLDYLQEKVNALNDLDRLAEATQLQEEIQNTRSELEHTLAQRCVYESAYNTQICQEAEIMNAFLRFAEKISTADALPIGDFFQGPITRVAKLNDFSSLIFTPGYVMHYEGCLQHITIIAYSKITISTDIYTARLRGDRQPNDEIEGIHYLHETKDGYIDMRYSYRNNPSYLSVYRGTAVVYCDDYVYEQAFCNKSLTEAFEKALTDYIKLITGKYRCLVDKIFTV